MDVALLQSNAFKHGMLTSSMDLKSPHKTSFFP